MDKRKPDVVFMQVQTPGIITGTILRRYPKTKFFNFNGDVREQIPEWHFDVAPYCTTLFTNEDWVQEIQKCNCKAEYFQIACDDKIYKPEGKKEIIKPVIFMGNNHSTNFPLSRLRMEMVFRFLNEDWFLNCGRGWNMGKVFYRTIDLNYQQQREAAIYRGSKIGINLSHMDLDSYTSDRMFRIMSCGTMCLAYKHKGIEKEFTNGVHLRTWQTLDELESLIEYYLDEKNQGERAEIAANGCKLVHEKYTWKYRMKNNLIPLLI